jgi:hypothetical protein
MDKYDIENGMLGMKRDTNIKLGSYLNENEKRNFFGQSNEYFNWKNHFLHKNLNKFPVIDITFGEIEKIPPNLLIGRFITNSMEIKERLYPNSGKYVLKIIPMSVEYRGIVIMLTEGSIYDNSDMRIGYSKAFQLNLGPLEKLKGFFKIGDLVKIEVDTNKKVVKCYINSKLIEERRYNLIKPLYFDINMGKNESIKIESFQHFLRG